MQQRREFLSYSTLILYLLQKVMLDHLCKCILCFNNFLWPATTFTGYLQGFWANLLISGHLRTSSKVREFHDECQPANCEGLMLTLANG